MSDYPSNSYRTKELEAKEEKKLEPIVQNETAIKKRGPMQRFADAFIAEDLPSVKQYVIRELLIPGLKRMFLSSLEMLLNGKGYTSTKDRQATSISYRDYYEKKTVPKETYRDMYPDFDNIIYMTKEDAEDIRIQLLDIQKYQGGVVKVSDMFELSRRPGPYTGNNYGWTGLTIGNMPIVVIRHAFDNPPRDGYMIKMPKAVPIDRI